MVNVIKKEVFGQKRIDKIKVSDAKEWLIKMQQIDGRGYSSIHTIRGVVRPAFQMAVDDDLLVKNPFEFQLNTVVVNDSVTRDLAIQLHIDLLLLLGSAAMRLNIVWKEIQTSLSRRLFSVTQCLLSQSTPGSL